MALTGSNGDNETYIPSSKSLDLSFYDADYNAIDVVNRVNNPIDFWISKDPTVFIEPFTFINALNTSFLNTSSDFQLINGFIVNGFNLSGHNQSIHVQIKPLYANKAYLSLLKFGDNPTFKNYDIVNLFCPSDLKTEGNDSFYLIFANMATVNSFRGYVGFSIAEIDPLKINCRNKSNYSVEWLMNQASPFTTGFELRTYASGCYYSDPLTQTWNSYGMEILSDSNITHTHCQSIHLTTFAGGFIVLPNAIDFNYVWAHASFLQNPVIYSTVIGLVCIYFLMAIWSRFMDMNDSKKEGLTLLTHLDDDESTNKYAYEIIVFTGARLNAGTSSNVREFIIIKWRLN